MTTKCNITLAKMKSPNARSGLIPWNSFLFCGLTCTRKHTAKTNDPTHEINPDRNELNGKVPTKQQYTNWKIPVSITYAR